METVSLPEDEKKFLTYFDELKAELRQANIHFQIWNNLNESISDYGRELNEATVFFINTIYAHIIVSVYHTCKLVDKHRDALGIYKLLNFIENNLGIFSSERFAERVKGREHYESLIERHVAMDTSKVRSYRENIESKNGTIDNLIVWRNKKLAHLDRRAIDSDIVSQYPVPIANYRGLLTTFKEIMNDINVNYNESSTTFGDGLTNDLTRILNAIRSQTNR